jgi:flagellar hook-associated protein 3 FlgL
MIGRMSSSQAAANFLAGLQDTYGKLAESQQQVSTGKRILKPSDDPVGVSVALGLRRDQAAGDAWGKNIDDSMTWLNTTDGALGQALDVVAQARELAVQGGNGTMSAGARGLIADQIDALRSQFAEIGNTNVGGRYIFGGTATTTPPFDPAAGTANAPLNTGRITREVAQGSVVSVNITADRLQGPGGATPDLFTTLSDLSASLRSGDTTGIDAALGRLSAHQDNISALRAEGAATTNRLELTQSRYAAQRIATDSQLSSIEDVDRAQAITDLTMRETVYKAALATGARVIQPSLVDFLS